MLKLVTRNRIWFFNLEKFLFFLFRFSLSECYFAGKGTALVLGQNETFRTLNTDGQRVVNLPTNVLSSSVTTGTNTCGSDIQQHLQSMFYWLGPEETLKMVSRLNYTIVRI